MSTLSLDEDVLQIFHNEDEILDSLPDHSYVNSDILFLKFYNKSTGNVENCISDIHELLREKLLKMKGFCFKGVNSVLIEVLLTNSLRNWLVVLVEARNNIRALSDKAKSDILKISFGKFNLIIKNELIHMNIIPNISKHSVDCKSSFYPYGLSNGNVINIMAKNIRDDPVTIIKNIVYQKAIDDKLQKLYAVFLEFTPGSDLSLRFIIKTDDVCDNLLKSLKSVFGNLTFCSSTLHYIPVTQEGKFSEALGSSLNPKEFWSILSEIDVLICNKNEQSLAMERKNIKKSQKLTSPHSQNNISPVSLSTGSSIFDRLGPNIIVRRTFASRSGTLSQASRSNNNYHE